ncbi:ankyrin repeat and SOCS box protein [Acrasis kona]|uniref:Ankyrin repeat and SOCS box protein n=1 Tax=Acrasis kona TaxID=1008807 RepID=A0AAW2Z5T3_9EUKA
MTKENDHEKLIKIISNNDLNAFSEAVLEIKDVNALFEHSNREIRLIHAVLNKSATDPVEMLRILVNNGADVNAKSGTDGQFTELTPLHYAVLHSENCVLYLLQKGANPNQTAKPTLTPLHNAILNQKPYTARILVDAKADYNVLNFDDKSSLTLAEEKGMEDIVRIIHQGESRSPITEEERYPEDYNY